MPMGIIKIRHQGPKKDSNELQHLLTLDEFVQDDHINELDDYELPDTGCEYAIVDEQICNVPYDLFELPDFKEVLSLETWNLCLTEEERFHLAAYLPDMDQETFHLTMSELLGGANFFFGSPMEILFHRLKGGLYSLQISQFRERLKFLYKRIYYHSLRSYHERMGQKIAEMRKAWSNCQPNTNAEERVQIFNNKKSQKPALLVDLNLIPSDEELSSKDEKKITGFANDEASTHVPAMDSNGLASNRRKAKGFLKIKPLGMNSKSKHTVLSLHTEFSESINRSPKGVLKIKPKCYPSNNMAERAVPISVPLPPHKSSDIVFGVCSPLHFATQLEEENLNGKLTNLYRPNQDRRFDRSSLTPEHTNGEQSKETRDICSRLFGYAHSSLTKMKRVKGITMCSDERSDLGESYVGQHSRVQCTSSAGLYRTAPDTYQRTIINNYQMISRYHDWYDGVGVRSSHMFPITYKRKKPHTKFGAVQDSMQPSNVASMEPLAPITADLRQAEKGKSMKIRVKGWKEFASQ